MGFASLYAILRTTICPPSGRESAIDHQVRPGDVARLRAGQVGHEAGDFLRLAIARQGHELLEGFGEIALVPHSSPVSQSGRLFYNTLFDENAATHVALGAAYKFTLRGSESMDDEAFASAGGNRSVVHVDFMIGSSELDIDGVSGDGTAEPLMRRGEWSTAV